MSEQLSIYRIKSGDVNAFKKLYLAYYKQLCFHAFKIISRKDIAEEVVQDVFINIWEKREKLNLPESISSYLYRAVLNESLNYIKKQKRLSNNDHDIQRLTNNSDFCNMETMYNETRQAIRQAVNKLPDKTRKIFILSRKYELSYPQIADKLDISIKTVEYHICNALKVLRKDLQGYLSYFFLYFSLGYNLLSLL